MENSKIQFFKCDILSNFQTMCMRGIAFQIVKNRQSLKKKNRKLDKMDIIGAGPHCSSAFLSFL